MESSWKRDLLHQLKRRNQRTASVRKLITAYNSAVETEQNCITQNVQFSRQIEKFEVEIKTGPESAEALAELRKVYERRDAQNQIIIELKEQLKEPKRQAAELEEFFQNQMAEQKKLLEETQELRLVRDVLHSELSELHIQLAENQKSIERQTLANKALEEKLLAVPREQAILAEASKSFFSQSASSSGGGSSSVSQSRLTTSSSKLAHSSIEGAKKLSTSTLGGACVLPHRKPATHVQAGSSECNSLCFSPTGNCFATGGTDRVIRVWDSITARCKVNLSGPERAINSVAFSQNDEFLLAASNDTSTRIWSLQTGRVIHQLMGHLNKVVGAAFTWDSKKVVTGSHDRTIKAWDLSRGVSIRSITCDNSCNDLTVSRDGNMAITGHLDASVRLWDIRNGELVASIPKAHSAKVTGVALHPDGNSALSVSRDHSLKQIDLRKGDDYNILQSYRHEDYNNGNDLTRCCFSSDGKFVVAGSNDGSVFIWNTGPGTIAKQLKAGHSSVVLCVGWNPNGLQLASGDKGGVVQLWTQTGP